jgi:predicted Zn-dependent peptidase
VKAAAKHLPLQLDVLTDMLLHSKFDPVEIEKERGVIIEEINMYEDTPMRKISDLYENLLYGDTKLGRDIAGRKEVIKSVKREDFMSYLDRFYGPSNTVITVTGAVDTNGNTSAKVKEMIEELLGGWKNRNVTMADPIDDKQDGPKLLVRFKDTQQAHLCLGVRSYHLTHPDRYKLAVMTTILGGGMSSRLFMEVREKRGLAYYVRSENEEYREVGNFVTQAGVDVARIEDAVKIMLEQFLKMTKEPVRNEEIVKAKEFLKGRLTLELEDSRSVAGLYATTEVLEDHVRTPKEIFAKLDEVTIEDVQNVAQDIFKEKNLNLAVIGPYKEEERFSKLLTFNH